MLKWLFKGSPSPNLKWYFLVPALSLGMLGQKLGAVVSYYLIMLWTMLCTGLISFSGNPHSTDGTLSKMVRHECEATRTIFVSRRPSHSHGMCNHGTKWPTHPPNPPSDKSIPWDQEYVPWVYYSGRSSRNNSLDSWQWWVKKTKLFHPWTVLFLNKHSSSPIQHGRPS